MTDAIANVDLFEDGRDPFSPTMIAHKPHNGAGNCEVVAQIVPTNPNTALLRIVAIGTPRPQGSKKAFYNAKLGRALIVDDNDAKLRTWRQDVVAAAVAAIRAAHFTRAVAHTPIDVAITFMMPRPKGHWRTGRNAHLLRDDAPKRPTTKPDGDKLTRATLDALRDAGVYVDDAQVVDQSFRKVWATERPGAVIEVREVIA
jgi:Holliday junction resolvase RusA-like endonuclease